MVLSQSPKKIGVAKGRGSPTESTITIFDSLNGDRGLGNAQGGDYASVDEPVPLQPPRLLLF